MQTDNNCLITRTSRCAPDILMAEASHQDQLLFLCLRPFPRSPRSCQAIDVPVHGRVRTTPHLTSPTSIWEPLPTAWQLCWHAEAGRTGRGKFPDLQEADDEEWHHCPVLSRTFQAGMCRWTGSTMGGDSLLEVPTSFPLCPLHYGIPLPLVAVVSLSRALGLALRFFILIVAH